MRSRKSSSHFHDRRNSRTKGAATTTDICSQWQMHISAPPSAGAHVRVVKTAEVKVLLVHIVESGRLTRTFGLDGSQGAQYSHLSSTDFDEYHEAKSTSAGPK
jgi:hypothetical protein